MDNILIGSSFSLYLIFPMEVALYTSIDVQLRSNDNADQVIAEFTKTDLRADLTDINKAWCDVDASATAKAYPTQYECVVTTTHGDTRFESGVETLIYKFDIVKFCNV